MTNLRSTWNCCTSRLIVIIRMRDVELHTLDCFTKSIRLWRSLILWGLHIAYLRRSVVVAANCISQENKQCRTCMYYKMSFIHRGSTEGNGAKTVMID